MAKLLPALCPAVPLCRSRGPDPWRQDFGDMLQTCTKPEHKKFHRHHLLLMTYAYFTTVWFLESRLQSSCQIRVLRLLRQLAAVLLFPRVACCWFRSAQDGEAEDRKIADAGWERFDAGGGMRAVALLDARKMRQCRQMTHCFVHCRIRHIEGIRWAHEP